MRAAGLDETDISARSGYWVEWWWNNINPFHLRLSLKGVKFVRKQTKIPIYTIDISHPLLSTHLIKLSRMPIGPYYIHQHTEGKTNRITVLDQEVATMLTLHAGNLGQYLENLNLD